MAADTSTRARANKADSFAAERRKMLRFLKKSGLETDKIKALEPVISNTSWMIVKLDEARALIGDGAIVVEYDNGGGQSGTRENPAFKAYEALWKAYLSGLGELMKYLPEERQEEAVEQLRPSNALELIQSRRQSSG